MITQREKLGMGYAMKRPACLLSLLLYTAQAHCHFRRDKVPVQCEAKGRHLRLEDLDQLQLPTTLQLKALQTTIILTGAWSSPPILYKRACDGETNSHGAQQSASVPTSHAIQAEFPLESDGTLIPSKATNVMASQSPVSNCAFLATLSVFRGHNAGPTLSSASVPSGLNTAYRFLISLPSSLLAGKIMACMQQSHIIRWRRCSFSCLWRGFVCALVPSFRPQKPDFTLVCAFPRCP